jgi:hypothetical protein
METISALDVVKARDSPAVEGKLEFISSKTSPCQLIFTSKTAA